MSNRQLALILFTVFALAILCQLCGCNVSHYTGGNYSVRYTPMDAPVASTNDTLYTSALVRNATACWKDSTGTEHTGSAFIYLPASLAYIVRLPDGTEVVLDDFIVYWK